MTPDLSRASIPTFFISPDGADAHCGVSFIVRSAFGARWLVTCAHIAGRGEAHADFSAWCRRLHLHFTTDRVVPLDIFDAAGAPIFAYHATDAGMMDVIAVPLSDAAFSPGAPLEGVFEIPLECSQPSRGRLLCWGWPDRGADWPYMPPNSEGADIITDLMATHEGPDSDGYGFSGSPAFDETGVFYGMRIGHGTGRTLYVPARQIFMLIHHFRDGMVIINTAAANSGRLAGIQPAEFRAGQLTVPAAKISGTLDVGNLVADEGILGEKVELGGVAKVSHEELSGGSVTTGTGSGAEAEILRQTVVSRGGPLVVHGWFNARKAGSGSYNYASCRIYRTTVAGSYASGDLLNTIPFYMNDGGEVHRSFTAHRDDVVFGFGDSFDVVVVIKNEAASSKPIEIYAAEMTPVAYR